jgi:hypothetical protein
MLHIRQHNTTIKPFRYLNNSQIIILPLTIYDRVNGLDGFRLYTVDELDGIGPYLDIPRATVDFYLNGCHSNGYLEARSLVFNDDILQCKGHTFLSYDLTTKLQVGGIDLNSRHNGSACASAVATHASDARLELVCQFSIWYLLLHLMPTSKI